MSAPDLSRDGLRAILAEMTGEDPADITDDTSVFELGVDSITLMQLVGTWRKAGVAVEFAGLTADPTLAGWAAALGETAAPAPEPEPVAAQPDGDSFGLALMQHAYWVGRGDEAALGGVAAHLYTEFDGDGVDPQRLRRAFAALVDRHDMLRVRVDDDGRQRIDPPGASGWRGLTVHDLRSATDTGAGLERVRHEMSHERLDLAAGEVLGTALSLLPGGRTRLHVDVDMVAADAVSYRTLLAELARLHADPDATLPPIGYSYREYLAARPAARRERAVAAARHWTGRLAELPGSPELPLAPDHPVPGPPAVRRRHVWLDPDERAALSERARTAGVTPAATVATAFAETLGAWSATPRFLLNVPLFDRETVHPDVGLLVGDFTSSVLLDVDTGTPEPFAARVRAAQSRLHADTAHADHSGVEVLRDLTRARGEQVLAPIVFTSALGLGELFDDRVRAEFGEPVWIVSQGPQVLLDAQVTELSGGLLVNWDSRESEFAPGVVDAMFDAFAGLVRRLCTDAAAWDRPVDGLVPDDVLARRRDGEQPGWRPSGRRLHEPFFERAAQDPDAPALVGDGGVVGYGELADRALRVAAGLAARGVAPGDPVGISLPKGPEQVVAVLGVLAAGGAYVPIGVEQPPARAGRIRSVAGTSIVLTPDVLGALEAGEPAAGPVPGDPEDLAYVLFTSGSTGEPKGVEVPHRAATATIEDLCERFALGPDDRTLALSALDFDLSVFDVFAPLAAGGAVVCVPESARREATEGARLLREHRATVLNCVPQLLDALLASHEPLGDSLRAVLLGGDRVGTDLPGRLRERVPGARFAGLGGTTETAIHSTIQEVDGDVPDGWSCVPYGRALRGVTLRVVDAAGRDVPDRVTGELWIGGVGVARGYRGDPDRTADRFVTREGTRWYRTGDLARWRPDGSVEFLGRRDDQVKLRGFRVELGEVEAALHAAGSRAAVAVVSGGRLEAAVVPGDPGGDLRGAVGELLPSHMVPERVVELEAVPLSANGKVDRRAVAAELARSGQTTEGVAPRTALERAVATVWADALDRDTPPGVTDEFFAVGGDSVLATAVVTGLREELGAAAVTVRMLFAAPTVERLAARLRAAEPDPARLDRAAAIFCEVADLSDEDVDAALSEVRS